jgi:hypothetical protein
MAEQRRKQHHCWRKAMDMVDWLRRLGLECCAQAMLAGKRNTVAILTILLWLIPIGTHAEVYHLPSEADLDTFKPNPLPHWTWPEKWVWKQSVLGESADFNVLYHEELDPTKDDQRWADLAKPRSLRNRFLQDVLNDESRSKFVHPAGLQIVGARFEEANLQSINLQSISAVRQVKIERSRIEGDFLLAGSQFARGFSLEGSLFKGKVDMTLMKVAGNLHLDDATFKQKVWLVNATVEGNFTANRTLFESVDMALMKVAGNLHLDDATFKQKVWLVNATVEGNFTANRTHFNALDMALFEFVDMALFESVDMALMKVAGNLHLDDATFEQKVYMPGAKVEGDLTAKGATFKDLFMNDMTVGQSLILTKALLKQLFLHSVDIGTHLLLDGAILEGQIDATSISIGGEIRLVSSDVHEPSPPSWGKRGGLVLRNAQVDAIQDRGKKNGAGDQNTWPKKGKLELDGFRYKYLDTEDDIKEDVADWYIAWLERDDTFTPQPYQQLARVFRETGDYEKANYILYAARERERRDTSSWWRWSTLTLLKWTIGYGIGIGYFWVLVWIMAMALIGTCFLKPSQNDKSWLWCFFASFDWMLPLVELDKQHSEVVSKLSGIHLYWFYVQAIAGYVLGSFIIAGLAGLTQGI